MTSYGENKITPYGDVDDQDKVLTSEQRGKVHEYGFYHRSIHVMIETFKGGFVLQKKAKGTENEGTWSSSVSGHVRYQESYEEAAIREIKEELGIEIEDPSELTYETKLEACEETGNEFVHIFSYLLDQDTEKIDPDLEEVEEVIIVDLDDVKKDIDTNPGIYSPAFILCLNKWLAIETKGMEKKNNE